MTVLVGVLHLTWNPVAPALKYDVIFKEKLREKGKVHKTISNKTVARINLEDIMQYKEVFVEVYIILNILLFLSSRISGI